MASPASKPNATPFADWVARLGGVGTGKVVQFEQYAELSGVPFVSRSKSERDATGTSRVRKSRSEPSIQKE